jgi:hypothetical protein
MSVPAGPSPDKVMQIITGGWAAAILGSAARLAQAGLASVDVLPTPTPAAVVLAT